MDYEFPNSQVYKSTSRYSARTVCWKCSENTTKQLYTVSTTSSVSSTPYVGQTKKNNGYARITVWSGTYGSSSEEPETYINYLYYKQNNSITSSTTFTLSSATSYTSSSPLNQFDNEIDYALKDTSTDYVMCDNGSAIKVVGSTITVTLNTSATYSHG